YRRQSPSMPWPLHASFSQPLGHKSPAAQLIACFLRVRHQVNTLESIDCPPESRLRQAAAPSATALRTLAARCRAASLVRRLAFGFSPMHFSVFRSLLSRSLAARTALLVSLLAAAAGTRAAAAFGFDDVAAIARKQARAPYKAPDRKEPAELAALNYDQYRDIRFRPDHALWRGDALPFEVMFFHEGKENVRVRMDEVVGSKVRHIPYSSADFNYGKNTLSPEKWGDLDFGGFRVHYPLNGSVYKDEVIVFLGASYFRALCAGARYGLSARGLAVDTVGGNGEEFPHFIEFWLVKPAADARSLTLFALLDGPRETGAYQFDVVPGDETVVEVRARLYLRAAVATLGIAPFTSMFQY